MDVVDRLRAAQAGPGLDRAAIARLQAAYPVPLPVELTDLLAATTGIRRLGLDLTGAGLELPRGGAVARLLPAGHPVMGDDAGNRWVLDLTADTVDVAPVFFVGQDPPLLLHQAPDLATFLGDVVAEAGQPGSTDLDAVRHDRLHDVWKTRPGAMSLDNARAGDQALRDFALILDPAWTVVDLRTRTVGQGLVWARYGPQTRVARHGWERIFGYAPYEPPRRTWRRFGRRARV
jgi:hypothetical protein